MTKYAAKTDVSTEKSRLEIERTLIRYGADQFLYGTKPEMALIAFVMEGKNIKFILPLPDKSAEEFTHYHHNSGKMLPRSEEAAQKQYEQACRSRWRALALVVKAKLEAVESGIAIFEEEFMAHIVLPNGATVAEIMLPQIEAAYETGNMPDLLPDFSGGTRP